MKKLRFHIFIDIIIIIGFERSVDRRRIKTPLSLSVAFIILFSRFFWNYKPVPLQSGGVLRE